MPSPVHYELPQAKDQITSTFGKENPRKNKPKENISNKVFNNYPGPGQYLVEQKNMNFFNMKHGFMGPKPKEFFLGRENRGSIYEDPTS